MKIKGKRYDYPNHEAMMVDVEKFVKAGDIIYSNANPITGEYWLQVILVGRQVKKEGKPQSWEGSQDYVGFNGVEK